MREAANVSEELWPGLCLSHVLGWAGRQDVCREKRNRLLSKFLMVTAYGVGRGHVNMIDWSLGGIIEPPASLSLHKGVLSFFLKVLVRRFICLSLKSFCQVVCETVGYI